MNTVELESENRNDLALKFSGMGVEVGVADGNFAEQILSTNPNVTKLYGVDPYLKHDDYQDYRRESTFEAMLEHAHAKLDKYGDRHSFIMEYSMDAVTGFKDNSLDFVYIDANHSYKTVMEDITEWSKKVKKGGIVCGDDYALGDNPNNRYRYDVIHAVNDYGMSHNIETLYLYTKGHEPTNWSFIK
jgi:hypothetical protein